MPVALPIFIHIQLPAIKRLVMVIGLVGIIDICIALGTVYFAEVGLDSATEAGSSDDLMARDASEPTGEEAAT